MAGSRKTTAKAPTKRRSVPAKDETAVAADLGTLVDRVAGIIQQAQSQVLRAVNSAMVLTYWHIGREIVEFVQAGAARAEYGEQVLSELSERLGARVGRGYSARNLRYFRGFFLAFAERRPVVADNAPEIGTSLVPNLPERPPQPHRGHGYAADASAVTVGEQGFSPRLSWSHYRTLCKVEDPVARAFYEVEAANANWSVPHLERQIHTHLHLRLLKSRDKAGVMELSRKGQTVERPSDVIKSPLVLDFHGLADHHAYRESDLETAILGRLSQFLLELGKGFAFVVRQKRMTFDDDQLFVDLVFYNVLLKCYLLIDLKIGRLTHQDVGQMDSYVRIFDAHERTAGDGPTIGLILCSEENHTIARYSVLNEHQQLFAAKYVTHMPSVEELQRELERDRRLAVAAVEELGATKKKGRRR